MNLVKNRVFIALAGLLLTSHLFIAGSQENVANNTDFQYSLPFSEIGKFQYNVIVVLDAKGKKFILKYHDQTKNAIYEILGPHVGKDIVNSNKVKILPSNEQLPQYSDLLSTLHTFIPGEHPSGYSSIYGAMREKNHLEYITKNDKSLAKIVAFNIYINNWDCHVGNLLYDQKINQFYVIDMDCAFSYSSRTLATVTHDYLKTLKKKELLPDEIKALKTVNKTLGKFSAQHPPEELYNEWIRIANEIGFYQETREKEDFRKGLNDNFNEIQYVRSQLKRLTYTYKNPFAIRRVLKCMAMPTNNAQQNFWQTMNS